MKPKYYAFSLNNQEEDLPMPSIEEIAPTSAMQKKVGKTNKARHDNDRKSIKTVGVKAQHFEIDKYYKNKCCESCHMPDDEQNMLLCDRCDDAYHIYCHNPPLECIPIESKWLCFLCQKDIMDETMSVPIETGNECVVCHLALMCPQTYTYIKEEQIQSQRPDKCIKVGYFTKDAQTCRYCGKKYHYGCFNQRKNAINCKNCQPFLRKNSPKSFEQYCLYIEAKSQFTDQFYQQYEFLENIQNEPKLAQTHRCLGLICPSIPTKTHTLIRSIISLFYALETCCINFIDQQVYTRGTAYLNQKQEARELIRMHPKDQHAFEEFKKISCRGLFGNIEVAQSKQLGFYVRALQFIHKGTILAEYVGQVLTSRGSLKQTKNKNIFSLVRTTSSSTSLDICPTNFGNISLFFAGINNSRRHLANVQTMRFIYKGRIRVLLFAKRDIQPEEVISMNYNGGVFKEYPTDDFE